MCRILYTLLVFYFANILSSRCEEIDSFNYFGCELEVKNAFPKYIWNEQLNERGIEVFFNSISHEQVKALTSEIKYFGQKLNLDDWGLFLLVEHYISNQLNHKNKHVKSLFIFMFLHELNYDVKLYFNNCGVSTYSRISFDTILTVKSSISLDSIKYFLINSSSDCNENWKQYTIQSKFNPAVITLDLNRKPKFCENKLGKTILFNYNDSLYKIKVDLDSSIIAYSRMLPPLVPNGYFIKIGLSDFAESSLFPTLKVIISEMSEVDALNILLYFCQSGISYSNDLDVFGEEKTLSPEETLFYGSGDCEDKSILFAYLVHELLNMKSVILIYEDHVNVGINIPEYKFGMTCRFDGIDYVIAEPTSQNRLQLGMSNHFDPISYIRIFD